ncbi:hypothetical protein CSC71_14920, partial [Pseudoxanthomonas sangjuensis]
MAGRTERLAAPPPSGHRSHSAHSPAVDHDHAGDSAAGSQDAGGTAARTGSRRCSDQGLVAGTHHARVAFVQGARPAIPGQCAGVATGAWTIDSQGDCTPGGR